jgi:thiol-disulfide isomerase/thioredoxin
MTSDVDLDVLATFAFLYHKYLLLKYLAFPLHADLPKQRILWNPHPTLHGQRCVSFLAVEQDHTMGPSRHSTRLLFSLLAKDLQTAAQFQQHSFLLKAPSSSYLRVAQIQKNLPATSTSKSRSFSTSSPLLRQQNRILNPFRTPSQFHDAIRLCSANNTLLLALFTTSACTPCRTITPLLTSLVETRPPGADDKFEGLAFAEVELDSPDMSDGSMMNLGVEWGVTSMPTLIGFGGRRAEKVTDRVTDTRMMSDSRRMGEWVDEQMRKGDPFAVGGGGGGEKGGGLLGRFFGR